MLERITIFTKNFLAPILIPPERARISLQAVAVGCSPTANDTKILVPGGLHRMTRQLFSDFSVENLKTFSNWILSFAGQVQDLV